jgi:hydroxyethylthiazole kinase
MNFVEENLIKMREKNPVIQCFTNNVVTNFTANVLLSSGASPIMSYCEEEAEEMQNIASALLLNIGTLDKTTSDQMRFQANISKKTKIPVIIDPVGAGASKLRTNLSIELINKANTKIIKGNSGEIAAINGIIGKTRGVDATISEESFTSKITIETAKKFNCTVVTTGKIDYISDGHRIAKIFNGSEMLQKITGAGCSLGALIGAFVSVTDPFEAAISAVEFFNIAAEISEKEKNFPGSFKIKLLDNLMKLNKETISKMKRVEINEI